MTSVLLAAAAETVEHHNDLPIPAWGFALIAFGSLMFFLTVCLSWRGISHRH